ncbi:hypothetical protein ES703_119787 [subsurface metagenome]
MLERGESTEDNPELRVEENLLTHTEHEVLRLARLDLSNRDIAEQLGIEMGTVRTHLMDIRRKLGVATREEAVAAFGKPTERERVPIRALRVPREIAAPYERRGVGLLTLVDELERSPSMETLGRLEDELHDLAGEVGKAAAATSGFERVRLSDLHANLTAAIQDAAVARAALETIERETLPMRIESGRRAFSSAIRLLRRDLWRIVPAPERIPEVPYIPERIPGVLTPERAAELRARLPRRFSRFIGSCREDEGLCVTHGYSVSKTVRCPKSPLTDEEWAAAWELVELAYPEGMSNPWVNAWWPETMEEAERVADAYQRKLGDAVRMFREKQKVAIENYERAADKATYNYRRYVMGEYEKGQELSVVPG